MRENHCKARGGSREVRGGKLCLAEVSKEFDIAFQRGRVLRGAYFGCRCTNTGPGWHSKAGGLNAVRRMSMDRFCSVIRVLSCLFQKRFLSWLSMSRTYGCAGLFCKRRGCKHCLKPFLSVSTSSTALIQAKDSTGFHPDSPCS